MDSIRTALTSTAYGGSTDNFDSGPLCKWYSNKHPEISSEGVTSIAKRLLDSRDLSKLYAEFLQDRTKDLEIEAELSSRPKVAWRLESKSQPQMIVKLTAPEGCDPLVIYANNHSYSVEYIKMAYEAVKDDVGISIPTATIERVMEKLERKEAEPVTSTDKYDPVLASFLEKQPFAKTIKTCVTYTDNPIELLESGFNSTLEDGRLIRIAAEPGQQWVRLLKPEHDRDSLTNAKSIACVKNASFKIVDVTSHYQYTGKILGVTESHIVQDVGRSAAIHNKNSLDRVPAKNEMVDIRYNDGIGKVEPRIKSQNNSLGR